MPAPTQSPFAAGALFSVLMVYLGFIAGAAIGSLFVAKADGLAGGATVFLGGVAGLAVALVAAILLFRRLAWPELKIALVFAFVTSVAVPLWIVLAVVNRQPAVGGLSRSGQPPEAARRSAPQLLNHPG